MQQQLRLFVASASIDAQDVDATERTAPHATDACRAACVLQGLRLQAHALFTRRPLSLSFVLKLCASSFSQSDCHIPALLGCRPAAAAASVFVQ